MTDQNCECRPHEEIYGRIEFCPLHAKAQVVFEVLEAVNKARLRPRDQAGADVIWRLVTLLEEINNG